MQPTEPETLTINESYTAEEEDREQTDRVELRNTVLKNLTDSKENRQKETDSHSIIPPW